VLTLLGAHLMENSNLCKVGLGLIWCGRQWPPNNQGWQRPSDEQIDLMLSTGFDLLGDGAKLMLDTASGYGESEQRVGSWLTNNATLASRCVIATKFGETFNCSTGETTTCHTAAGAMTVLEASLLTLSRPIDLFYSHITSQLTEAQAEAVLADDGLRHALVSAKAEGKVGMLGTSCSYPNVVRTALRKGWLDELAVVQLPARTCVAEPELIAELRAAGKLVIANSPVRRVLAAPDEAVTNERVAAAVAELMAACPEVACVLVGTGKQERLRHIAGCILSSSSA